MPDESYRHWDFPGPSWKDLQPPLRWPNGWAKRICEYQDAGATIFVLVVSIGLAWIAIIQGGWKAAFPLFAIVGVGFPVWYQLGRLRALAWANSNEFSLHTVSPRFLRCGPVGPFEFTWVFRITGEESDGKIRSGWLCVGKSKVLLLQFTFETHVVWNDIVQK